MPPSAKYAVEAMYEGNDPPWKGWKVIRTYSSARTRDEDLARLRKNLSTNWRYRIKE